MWIEIKTYNIFRTLEPIISITKSIVMDSTNSESAANSRYTNTVSFEDELDRC